MFNIHGLTEVVKVFPWFPSRDSGFGKDDGLCSMLMRTWNGQCFRGLGGGREETRGGATLDGDGTVGTIGGGFWFCISLCLLLIVLIGVGVGILIGCDMGGWSIAFGASVTLGIMRLLSPLAVMSPIVDDVIDDLSFDAFGQRR